MRLKRFGHAMTGTTRWEDGGGDGQANGERGTPKTSFQLQPVEVFQGFYWAGLREGSLVVDVGGGIGSTSMTLAKAFPHLRFCIQDRPKTVEHGVTVRSRPLTVRSFTQFTNPGVERAVP